MGSVANPEGQMVFYADTFYNADVCTPGSSLGVHVVSTGRPLRSAYLLLSKAARGRLYSATLAAEEG